MRNILVINGPNINMLGVREPDIYGHETYEEAMKKVASYAEEKGFKCEVFQSNSEGGLIDRLHAAFNEGIEGIIMNAGAYTHYSLALHDAIKAINIPVVEVHISNIFAREGFRETSVTGRACKGVISGFGIDSYLLAVDFFNRFLGN